MSQRNQTAQVRLSPETMTRLKAAATEQGVTVSEFLRLLVAHVTEDVSPERKPVSKARREGKLTVRIPLDARNALGREAKEQGVAPSTWAANVLTARLRSAPQPVKRERRLITKAFFQLMGIGRNLNQMAYAMNKGILVGEDRSRKVGELRQLQAEVEALRSELRTYASGRYKFQAPSEEGNT